MTTVFINMWLISPWLIWNSYLLYYIYVDDKSFQFVITSRRQRLLYWFYLVIFLFFGIYIFLIRLSRITVSINIYRILEISQEIIKSLSCWSLLGLGIFSLLLVIFWLLLLRHVYGYLRKCLYSLFMYYYQYDSFRELMYTYSSIHGDFLSYLYRRVKIFTSKETILANALFLWPYCFFRVEERLFRYLVPYLIIFDIFTQNGNISNVFIILPWFYIYTIFKSTKNLLENFRLAIDLSFVEAVYGLK